MIRPALVQMFLSSAYLCPDCDTVSNDSRRCPRCHSAVIGLAGVLNREEGAARGPDNESEESNGEESFDQQSLLLNQ